MKQKLLFLSMLLIIPAAIFGESNIEKAIQAFDSGDSDAAIMYANEELKINPESSDAYTIRGLASANTNTDDAISDFSKALSVYKEGSTYTKCEIYSYRGTVYNNIGNTSNALEDYNEAIKNNNISYVSYKIRGSLFYKMEQYDDAIKDYKQALEIYPHYADACQGIADCYLAKNELDSCINYVDLVLAYKPELTESYLIRAYVEYLQEKYEDALSDYFNLKNHQNCIQCGYHDLFYELIDKIPEYAMGLANEKIQSDSTNVNYLLIRFEISYRQKKYKQAIEDLSYIIKIQGEDPVILANRAISYYKNGEYENAIIDLTAYLQHGDDDKKYRLRALIYRILGSFDDAEKDLTKLIEIDPTNASYYSTRGMLKLCKKNYNDALKDFNQGLIIAPESFEIHRLRGKCYQLLSDTANATVDFNYILENDTVPDIKSQRHYVLAYTNKDSEAIDWLDTVIMYTMFEDNLLGKSTSINDAFFNYLYGRIYAIIGNLDKAIYHLYEIHKTGDNTYWSYILNDSDWDSIRKDKRYKNLVKELKKKKILKQFNK